MDTPKANHTMKTTRFLHSILAATATILLSFTPARAGEVLNYKFDSSSDANSCYWENWSAAGSLVHDPVLDAGGGGVPGSLRFENNFLNSPGSYQQCVFTIGLPSTANAEQFYSHVNLDVKVDPSSTPRAAGDYGSFEIILRNGSGWTWNGRITVPLTNTDWVHVSAPVGAPANDVHHLTFKLGQNALLGTVVYNIDNITWTEASTPPPPPTLGIRLAKPGLNFVGSSAGAFDRQNIYAQEAITSWVGAFDDLTFSMTINDAPGAGSPNYQAHMFIVQGGPGTDSVPDWTLPNVVFIQIVQNANGTASAYFRVKVNEPGNNTQFWAPGAPSVTAPSMLGTWSVTFFPDTNVVLTAPNGATNSFGIPAATAAAFSSSLTPYFGFMPNSAGNIGKVASLSQVRVSAAGSTIVEDEFPGPSLDPVKWGISAADPSGVKLYPVDTAGVWISWTVPDTGFVIQSSPTLSPPNWTPLGIPPIGSTSRQLHVPKGTPAADQGYFQLFKQP